MTLKNTCCLFIFAKNKFFQLRKMAISFLNLFFVIILNYFVEKSKKLNYLYTHISQQP